MQLRTKILKSVTPAALLVTMTASSLYASVEAPGPLVQAPRNVTITAQNLESELFNGDPDIIHEINAVSKAKDMLNEARANLLPSINITGLVGQVSPMFMLSSVSCLVPFLFPSKWFDLKTSKKTYQSEQVGLKVTKLNVFATAYTLISRVEGDEATLLVTVEQDKRFDEYLAQMKTRLDAGLIPLEDYELAEIDSRQRDSNLSKMRQLVDDEHATMRKLFGYPLTTEFNLALGDVGASDYETVSPTSVIDHVIAIAPEKQQLDLLAVAAKASIRSSQWSFLSGCGGGQSQMSSVSGGNSFNLSTGASANLGFGIFPQVKLARHNALEVGLRAHDLGLELGRLLEDTIEAAQETKIRLADADANVKESELVLTKEIALYASGHGSIVDVIHDYSIVAQARTDYISASTELAGHRITLKRLAMADQFAAIMAEGAPQK